MSRATLRDNIFNKKAKQSTNTCRIKIEYKIAESSRDRLELHTLKIENVQRYYDFLRLARDNIAVYVRTRFIINDAQ